ncbi:MAG: hypothetical protein KKD99_01100 [Proteobacteria bacterium]|nr:hypothetical protein [Pseudomonadota bacterium]
MNTGKHLWQPPNGGWPAVPGRNKRGRLGTRELAEAPKLYRRIKAEFLLNQVTFPDGSRPGPKTPEGFIGVYPAGRCGKLTYNPYSQGHIAVRAHLAQARTTPAQACNLGPIPQER